ncbi:hypothetical protein J0A68_03620 [Algoriphagus sp. H41]|uniref:Uncharacterized protein n=1 Tax=Algoriphagus oliviformis TaxID=2811231 RepID=A0ABS3C067_9BACT|nr:hypothetical protein [Algoriphagus oliviformis]MBN7810029.1 hypothetical protein [Algoriphagus oliviformis]
MRTELLPFMFRDWISVSNYVFLVLLCIVFFRLPSALRKRSDYLLPFIYIFIFVTIDPVGFGFRLFQNVNGPINEFFGNHEKPFYNAWLYNIVLKMAMPVVALLLVKNYLPAKQQVSVKWILIAFVSFAIVYQALQLEPIYLNQGILFAVGALCMLSACFIYYHALMTREEYVFTNILLLPSFWQVTFIMFYTSLTYFNNISANFLTENHSAFLVSMYKVSRFTGVAQSLVYFLCLAAPLLKLKVENQPNYA